jgi:hypothetical protein
MLDSNDCLRKTSSETLFLKNAKLSRELKQKLDLQINMSNVTLAFSHLCHRQQWIRFTVPSMKILFTYTHNVEFAHQRHSSNVNGAESLFSVTQLKSRPRSPTPINFPSISSSKV